MTRYTADSRDRVRDAVDMVAVVSERTELRRSGAGEYVGRCPFHDERTPSFGVNTDAKVYYCFGCQASGDLFTFVMETEGLDFVRALETLADRFGVQLETVEDDPGAASRRQRTERLRALLERAAGYYARYLWEAREAQPARAYLLGRGLREETLRNFRVGYAPSAWDRMLTASRRAGFSDQELLAVGLAQRSKTNPGRIYDRFRERIMFPCADARGRVLGFGARAMRENQQPKYLNTAEGEIYQKRSVLFGIDRARATAARERRMILVEGYTDVLALHQAGLVNAVGIMGTALTEKQVGELRRVAKVLVLCLDADRAGQEAMLRAAELTRDQQVGLQVVPLPDGTDPAELIERAGADALRERLAMSEPFVEFELKRIRGRADIGSAEGRERAARETAAVLARLPDGVERNERRRQEADWLGIPPEALASLEESVEATPANQGAGTSQSSAATTSQLDQDVRAEQTFLAMCIAAPEAGEQTLSQIDPDELLTSSVLRRAARHLAGRAGTPLGDIPRDDEDLARVIAALVARAGRLHSVAPEHVEHARLVLEKSRIERAIRRARADGASGIGQLATNREMVLERIRQVVSRLERAL